MKVNLRGGGPMALVLLLTSSHLTAHDLGPDEALRLRQKGVIAPLEHLLGPALERYPGAKLLDAELEEHKDRPVPYIYEIELLTVEGVVREIELDASTGALLKDKEDD
ncbi:PepSY domain-containing protein [Pseudomonas sp. R11F]|uniref:Peptidase n=1 Tax=Pseudomonas palleroniana TaxID=191390 RepID=A0A109FQZ4_9PSED|nr:MULTISPECIES: PepSY domain-containing protein [Pseudomonas]AVE03052.1 peptidase [Pseudomonas palleroniana]KWU52887.1 peptidase [Pseudomonas palleroniana]MBI6911498.1 PepSY domain-containing protein [Pseudomonas palleroniana]MBM9489635.1 PepSY domain-containing protein [Pseudomonas sp. ICBG1301]NCE88019.1 peptidase [Pseudomonas sp. Q1]